MAYPTKFLKFSDMILFIYPYALFIYLKCPSLFLVGLFALMLILYDINLAIQAFFFFVLHSGSFSILLLSTILCPCYYTMSVINSIYWNSDYLD